MSRTPAWVETALERDGLPIDVQIPSDVRFIERVVDLVARGCAARDFPPRACRLQVPVALTEAMSNAILYGNGADARKAVRVRAEVTERALVLEVFDEGTGFDLAASLREPTEDDALEREDGRGLFLMSRLMDRVECFTDGGSMVRMTLHRT